MVDCQTVIVAIRRGVVCGFVESNVAPAKHMVV
jgi:hypothetical protein